MPCTHIPIDLAPPTPTTPQGCTDCVAAGRNDWVHLRLCQSCGYVGCCDSSPGQHARKHFNGHPDHPIIRSMEPGENWWYCYTDDEMFEISGTPPSPTRTDV